MMNVYDMYVVDNILIKLLFLLLYSIDQDK